ncbi:MAG TPA: hypothetical protein VHY91_05725 [Pirellulales bacterium]|jgi:hypothetical protein|nr:hypothetical protein [Pirellulales bacterium]
MRRFRDRQSSKLFRGGEMAKMMAMIGMLLVVGMMILRARDADTWRFLASDPAPAPQAQGEEPAEAISTGAEAAAAGADSSAADEAQGPAADGDRSPDDSPPVDATPPLDEDAEERAALTEEFQAITDRSPLAKEDMFAYWRLLRWTESVRLPAMLKRARTDVRYGDLILDPTAYRGDLLKVRLHVAQVLKFQAAADNPLGIETYYQAVGWNDASQAWFYFCIFTDLPPGMPLGDRVTQEGTFVGYFLKTTTYQDGQGKRIQAPVLIGRMVWHPSLPVKPREQEGPLTWVLGGVLIVGFLVRMVWRMRLGKKREPLAGVLRGRPSSEEPVESVEDWLDRAESPAAGEAINGAAEHESNGNPNGHSAGFPRDPRLDQSEEPGG